MPVGDIMRIRAVTYANDQVAVNVRHFRVSAVTGTQATPLQIATAFDGALAPAYKNMMSVNANYRGVGCQKIFPLPPALESTVVANAGAGLVAGNLLSRQTAGIMTIKTASAGRKYRGRIYYPFPSVGSSDANGIPTNAYLALIGAIAIAWGLVGVNTTVAGVGGNTTLVPIIWHRATNTYDDVTSSASSQKWATQRRRGSFGRVNVLSF